MKYVPIVLFCYSRIDSLEKCLNSLALNREFKDSEVYFFCDKNMGEEDLFDVNSVQNFIQKYPHSNKHIIIRERHYGLRNNIKDGLDKIFSSHQKVIVVEDDLIFSEFFLGFMNEALNFYETDTSVGCISGYSYINVDKSVFRIKNYADCLGWGTWRDRWREVNFDTSEQLHQLKSLNSRRRLDRNYAYPYYQMLKNNLRNQKSWAINWLANAHINNLDTIYSGKNLVKHQDGKLGTNYNSLLYLDDPLNIELVNLKVPINKFEDICSLEEELKFRWWLIRFEQKILLATARKILQLPLLVYLLPLVFRRYFLR